MSRHPDEHKKTDVTKGQVEAMVRFGATQEQIASYLKIDVKTLVKHYDFELKNALLEANFSVANNLFVKAIQQDDYKAQEFWLKTRGRWRTRDSIIEQDEKKEIREDIKKAAKKLDKENERDY